MGIVWAPLITKVEVSAFTKLGSNFVSQNSKSRSVAKIGTEVSGVHSVICLTGKSIERIVLCRILQRSHCCFSGG